MQLQANREKNGIYVQPDIFYGMETRISAQEAQISEVESILKMKVEETKEATLQKDSAIEQLTSTKKELDITATNLMKTTEVLNDTQDKLILTTTELGASNAVITEQVVTETNLLDTGTELQTEVRHQRTDRDLLLNKIINIKNNDNIKLNKTNEFVNNIVQETQNLCSRVNYML